MSEPDTSAGRSNGPLQSGGKFKVRSAASVRSNPMTAEIAPEMTQAPDTEAIELFAKAIRDALPRAVSGNGLVNEYTLARAALQSCPDTVRMREALEYIIRQDGRNAEGFIDWQRCVNRIQEVASQALSPHSKDGR